MQGSAGLWLRLIGVVLAATVSLQATNHQIRFDEVMAGLGGDTTVQYIIVSANGNGQKDWGPQGTETESRSMLVFFDGAGNQTGTFKIPIDPPDGANTVLIATAAFTNRTGLRADIIMPPLLSPGSGKVCFKENPANPAHFDVNLCLSYGNFPPNLAEGAGAPAPALPVAGEPLALVRFQNFAFVGTNQNADFRLGTPHPTNTANQTVSFVGPGPTIAPNPPALQWPTTPFPPSNLVQRTITLRNIGVANPLSMASVTIQTNLQNDFSLIADTGEGTLAPGAARSVTIGFFPRAPGLRQAALRVQSNDPEQPLLALALSGRAVNVDPCGAPDLFGAFAQNSCADAMLAAPGVVYTGNTAGATRDGNSPCDIPPFNMIDVWFKYVAGANGNLNVSFSGSDSNTAFSLQRGCTGNTNAIFCTLNPVQPFNIFVTNSQQLMIRVSSRSNAVANFRMLLTGPAPFDFDRNRNGRHDGCEFDFGDAPGPGFPTLAAADGARHRINNNLFLGRFRDADADGQPTARADGDNLDGERNDDEGVTVLSPLLPGAVCALTVTANGNGFLNGWVDFNADGDWNDAGERIFNNIVLNSGGNNRGFQVPSNAVSGNTFARFRFSSTGNSGPEGIAEDGEVEDYAWEISQPNPVAASIKVRFNEIMAGLNGDSSVQFIELEALDDAHKNWGQDMMLAFFDALGRQTGRFIFPSNAPAGGDTVLMATPKFAERTGLRPDFLMPPELMAISGKVVFRSGAESIALAYGGNGYYGTTEGAGPPNQNQLPILDARSLTRLSDVPFGLNQNRAFDLATPTPRNTAGQTATLADESLINQGQRVFASETFNGNGRTCQTCHLPGRDQFGLTTQTVRSLPPDDALFVFEPNINILRLTAASFPGDLRGSISGSSGTARVLAGSADTYYVIGGSNLSGTISDTNGNSGAFSSFQAGDLRGPNPHNGSLLGLEDPVHVRGPRALILENIDGFTQREVLRTSPHLLNLELTAPYGLSGEFTNLIDFSDGAVVQHFSRSLERVPDRDFRHATLGELQAMEAFQNSIKHQRVFAATTEAQKRGKNLFFSDESKCFKCHSGPVLANADGSLTGTVAGRNETFDTGIANQLTNLLALPTEPAGLAAGQSTRKFNTPPLFGIRLTAPFFHDGSAATLTEAVRFYDSSEFVASPAGDLVGAVLAANQPDKVADIVAFLESLVELPLDFTAGLDFGVTCSTGQPLASLFAFVTNTSTAAIPITAVSIAGTNAAEFQIVSDTGQTNLAPGGIRAVRIAFAPPAIGLSQATLEFTAQALDIPGDIRFGVALEGAPTEARADIFPTQLTFAPRSIDAGASPSEFITISNSGLSELVIRNFSANPSNAAFLMAPFLEPICIQTNSTFRIGIAFNATNRGPKAAVLNLDLIACNLQRLEIPISGFATSRVERFAFAPLTSTGMFNTPFPLEITARDRNNDIVTDYSGTVFLNAHPLAPTLPAVLITEIDPGNPDRVEIANLSGRDVQLSGLRLLLYDSFPAPKCTIILPSVVLSTNGIFTVTEGGVFPGAFPNLFTGTNLAWVGGSDQIAALLLDAEFNVIDFVTTGTPVPPEGWRPPGVSVTVEDGATSYQRRGSMDHNDASDWIAAPVNINSPNPDLLSFRSAPFGSVPISLESVAFANGAWSGGLSVFTEAGNLRLAATDAAGVLGVSLPFNIRGAPPTIGGLPTVVTTDEDISPPLISFQISDLETPAHKLTVTAGSTDPGFIPATNLVLQGTGAVRTLQIILPTNQFGMGSIWIAVGDAANVLVTSFDLDIRPVNDPPRIVVSGLRENFDAALAPALPAGWTSSGLWQTATNNHDSPPNAGFVPNPAFTSDSRLDSPEFFVFSANAQLSFRHFFLTENCCDGGTLELSVAGQSFTNIGQAGGTFLAGPPNSPQGFWRGIGAFTTLVRLPNAAIGKLNRLRWRFTSNDSIGFPGWSIDSINLIESEPISATIDEDMVLITQFHIEDPDRNPVPPAVSVSASDPILFPPENLEVIGSGFSRTLIARPFTNGFGATEITVTVDDEGGPVNVSLPLQVRSINDPPVIAPIPNHTVFVGNLLQQQITAVDPDGTNTVRYTIQPAVGGASINLTNGLFTWRPASAQAGSNFIRIQVIESSLPSVFSTQSFHVIVLPIPLLAAPLAFPTQCVAQAATLHGTLTITNNSTNTVPLSSIRITGSNALDFAIHDHSGETNLMPFAPGERRAIDIEFSPQSVGRKQAVLEVGGGLSAPSPQFVFQVSLTGTFFDMAVEVSPPELIFADQDMGVITGPTQNVVVRSVGQSPLRISAIQLAGTNSPHFILSNVGFPILTNGQTHTFQVRFAPQSRGAKSATLVIVTDSCMSNNWRIPVTGTATSVLHHFAFDPIVSPRYDVPFPVRITAKDINNETVPEFSGPVWLYTAHQSPVLITEVDPGSVDQVEFINVSPDPTDVSGWQVVFYDPPPIVRSVVTLPNNVLPGHAIFTLRPPEPVGWTGTNTALAVLLRNAAGDIMDFFSSTSATAITDPIPIPPQEWSGPGLGFSLSEGRTYQRRRDDPIDHNNSLDWVGESSTMGSFNSHVGPFFGMIHRRSLSNIVTFVNGVATTPFAIAAEVPSARLIAVDAEGRWTLATVTVAGDPPLLTGLPATIDLLEDAPPQLLPFQIADAETPLSKLSLRLSCSNCTLIPNLFLGGTNADRSLSFILDTNRFGRATITIEAFDAVQATTRTIVVNVRAVNDPPVLTLLRHGSIFEDFDSVLPPALPAGWNATSTVPAVVWRTILGESDSPSNSVFVPNLPTNSDISLVSPAFIVESNAPVLSFRHQFNTEICCDHGRLELGIGTNAFANITSLGGIFSVGGYGSFSTWSGSSGGFITSTIQLPATTLGQTVRLRWRFTSDSSIPGVGWWLDTITVTNNLSPNSAIITLNEDALALVQFTVADIESGSEDLQITAVSSNPLLLPVGNIVFGGFGSNRMVTFTPVADAFGAATVHLVVSDGLANTSAPLQFNYIPVNDLPVLAPIGDVTAHAQTPLAIPLGGFDPDQTPLTYQLLTPLPGASLLANIFHWTPLPTQLGTHTLNIRVIDTQAPGFAEQSFTVTVVPALALAAARLSPTGAAILSCDTIAGARYRIEHTTDLASPDWLELTEIVATNASIAFEDPLPRVPQRFFRILFLP